MVFQYKTGRRLVCRRRNSPHQDIARLFAVDCTRLLYIYIYTYYVYLPAVVAMLTRGVGREITTTTILPRLPRLWYVIILLRASVAAHGLRIDARDRKSGQKTKTVYDRPETIERTPMCEKLNFSSPSI